MPETIEVDAEKLYTLLRAVAEMPPNGWDRPKSHALIRAFAALGIAPPVSVKLYTKSLPTEIIKINGRAFALARVKNAIDVLDTPGGRVSYVNYDDHELMEHLEICQIVKIDSNFKYKQGIAYVEFCNAACLDIDQLRS